MKLFLDTSVLLAACGSETGSSRAIVNLAALQGWELVTSSWVEGEVARNVPKLGAAAFSQWPVIRARLSPVADVVSLNRITVLPASKDRPVLLTAFASAQVLLTLDRVDFLDFLGRDFYGMPILSPSDFLIRERWAGRLS